MAIRPQTDIQRAHDILRAIALGEVPSPFASKTEVHRSLDVLCWVLNHDHNRHFADNLEGIASFMRDHGLALCVCTVHALGECDGTGPACVIQRHV